MRKLRLIIAVFALIALASCQNNQKKEGVTTDMINHPSSASEEQEEVALGEFEFENDVIDFGEISQGEKVERTFTFTNIGEGDLIISNASGSCGCTVPDWPRNPIAPGESGEIKVVFDSNGKQGRQHKTVTLVANTTPNTTVIAIKGDVLTPDQQIEKEG